MYEYWLAGNGLHLRAKREGISVLMPLAKYHVRGLDNLTPYLKLDYPPVPLEITNQILELSRQVKDAKGNPIEKLFYLSYSKNQNSWQLCVPAQIQTRDSITSLESGANSSYVQAFLELHSHHEMNAYFSKVDDTDEKRSFRLFAVLGNIFERPEIRVRVGVFGHFWQITATGLLELGDELHPVEYPKGQGEWKMMGKGEIQGDDQRKC
jgi:PRTRC genetic system protein A